MFGVSRESSVSLVSRRRILCLLCAVEVSKRSIFILFRAARRGFSIYVPWKSEKLDCVFAKTQARTPDAADESLDDDDFDESGEDAENDERDEHEQAPTPDELRSEFGRTRTRYERSVPNVSYSQSRRST